MTWLLVTRCPLVAQRWRFWASFPGIHIAQFPFQVIGNCGVIFLMQCSNRQKLRMSAALNDARDRELQLRSEINIFSLGPMVLRELGSEFPVGDVHTMTVSWRWRLASVSAAAWG